MSGFSKKTKGLHVTNKMNQIKNNFNFKNSIKNNSYTNDRDILPKIPPKKFV